MLKQNRITKLLALLLILSLALLVLAGCGTTPNSGDQQKVAQDKTVVDHAGRTVTVPATINKVFSTSPVGMILMYTLAPEKLVAWNFEILPTHLNYILPEYHNLPNLGGWYANKSCNVEELLKINPDVIISIGAVSESDISSAEDIQKQTGIPVVLVDGEITKMDQTYLFMGDLVDAKERAAELASYCRSTVDDVAEKVKQILQDQRVRVYYAEGQLGLDTDPAGSQHTQVLDLVGGINVADVPMKGGAGMTAVSLEQVLAWDPDVIITANMNPLGVDEGVIYKHVTTDPKWSSLQAVQNKKVYDIPDRPFNWFDRPPSVNRMIGVKWLANLLYPEIFPYDMPQEIREFYAKFYHYDLTDQEIDELLAHSKAN